MSRTNKWYWCWCDGIDIPLLGLMIEDKEGCKPVFEYQQSCSNFISKGTFSNYELATNVPKMLDGYKSFVKRHGFPTATNKNNKK